ncbi:Lipoprotein-anchoring transpeptidase ErfK/SrfK [Arthrobacter alpinus]|uniref:Lipoprotein-anchoring transpeptidase ErfK/SrfK n=1 Tax=Arthrobacter alpinus TaxID=656366 RepID=A0A1H5KLW1_9MICC|nr:Ig-like domain-containing protein [Arthrobacter alpinus]SEE65849.1 Lipoprotein-anchoring transpeptidase ErfK/SrfK [Arthrobacter alpinus]
MSQPDQSKKSRLGLKIALAAVVVLAIGGGGIGVAAANSWLPGEHPSATQTETATPSAVPTTPAATPVTLALSPKTGATSINPADEVTALAENGTVYSAVLKETATGETIDGGLFISGRKWVSSGPLQFATDYTFDVTTEDEAGNRSTTVSTFTTVPASNEADLAMYPATGSTVGVAQPLQFTFSEPVKNKEAVEKAISITASSGQKGAFRWYSDTLLRYRAEDFWAANTKITVEMKLFGVDFGDGQIGNFNKTDVVQIGNKVEMVADAANLKASIYINGALVKEYPVTMGDERFPSASGYLVLLSDKQRNAHFVASSIGLKPGDPANYGEVDVEYASRLTPSGEFIHQATDSAMPYLGQVNLSHGCIGMSAEGASWVFNNMGTGDLVHVVGSPNETIAPTDGFGDWNIPFAQYAQR